MLYNYIVKKYRICCIFKFYAIFMPIVLKIFNIFYMILLVIYHLIHIVGRGSFPVTGLTDFIIKQ